MKKLLFFILINSNVYGSFYGKVKEEIFHELETINYEMSSFENIEKCELYWNLCGQKQAYEHTLEIIYFNEKESIF